MTTLKELLGRECAVDCDGQENDCFAERTPVNVKEPSCEEWKTGFLMCAGGTTENAAGKINWFFNATTCAFKTILSSLESIAAQISELFNRVEALEGGTVDVTTKHLGEIIKLNPAYGDTVTLDDYTYLKSGILALSGFDPALQPLADSTISFSSVNNGLADLNDIAGNTFGIVVAVGDTGKILRSVDFGETFEDVTAPVADDLTSVEASGSTFIIGTSAGDFLVSNDSGQTYTTVASGQVDAIADIKYLTGTTWLSIAKVSSSMYFLRTTDSGQNWSIISAPSTGSTSVVNGIAYGAGVVIAITLYDVVRSTDNGLTWNIVPLQGFGIEHVAYNNGVFAFISGAGSSLGAAIAVSNDLGLTFDYVAINTPAYGIVPVSTNKFAYIDGLFDLYIVNSSLTSFNLIQNLGAQTMNSISKAGDFYFTAGNDEQIFKGQTGLFFDGDQDEYMRIL